ncbi:MAG: MATE family efflux transporter [Bacteroidota bacterium]
MAQTKSTHKSTELGTKPIGKLLASQAIPAAIGILIVSLYMIVDTIFVGRFVDPLGIGALTVVMPITFLIASVGMAIGVGSASIISRALGANDPQHARHTFANATGMTLTLAFGIVIAGSFFEEEILMLFGGKADILPFAKEYFRVVLWGVPFLAWAMMSNNLLRSVGLPKVAMMIMIIPAIANVIFDPIFILVLDMGMAGAALATVIAYVASATFGGWYLLSGRTELTLDRKLLRPNGKILKEIFAIGGVTLARQGTVSLLYLVLNNVLFSYGGPLGVSVYGIVSRVMMFANFPVLGVTQGFLPIAGYNHGAEQWSRVKKTIILAIGAGTAISTVIFIGILLFPGAITRLFSTDAGLVAQTIPAMTIAFLAMPLITIQLVGSAYYQAIGKALPALLLTLTKQGFFLIPLVLLLPGIYGLNGVWYAFPVADVLSTVVTFAFLARSYRKINVQIQEDEMRRASEADPETPAVEMRPENLVG